MPSLPRCCCTSEHTGTAVRTTSPGTVLLIGWLWLIFAIPASAGGPPRFHATFLQLWNAQEQWPDARWDRLCAELREMQIDEVILQWSLVTERPFFWRLTPQRRAQVPDDTVMPAAAVDHFVQAARRARLRVRFGLTHDPHWWTEITNPPQILDSYLHRLRQDQIALARTLWQRYGQEPFFDGFYIPQEIDDKTWLDAEKYARLRDHLQALAARIRTLSPQPASLAISGFCNGYADPAEVETFWRDLLQQTRFDRVLVQDGVGVGKLTLAQAALYLQATARGAAAANARAEAIVEILRPAAIASGSTAQEGFMPASMTRIRRQLQIAHDSVGAGIVAFSLPEYATSAGDGGAAATALGKAYRRYLESRE